MKNYRIIDSKGNYYFHNNVSWFNLKTAVKLSQYGKGAVQAWRDKNFKEKCVRLFYIFKEYWR